MGKPSGSSGNDSYRSAGSGCSVADPEHEEEAALSYTGVRVTEDLAGAGNTVDGRTIGVAATCAEPHGCDSIELAMTAFVRTKHGSLLAYA